MIGLQGLLQGALKGQVHPVKEYHRNAHEEIKNFVFSAETG